MKAWKIGLIGFAVMLVGLTSHCVSAQNVESLLMPGEVVTGHAEFESDCNACHRRFRRSDQRELCLDCHEDVANDINEETGFHGKFDDAKNDECATCHTDHEGRSADIVDLDEATFDHLLTDFELLGKHADAECVDCHEPGDKHRDATGNCFACHSEDDEHQGALGEDCAECHNPADEWVDAEFDHDTTDFALIGEHQKIECLDCHEDATYQNAPTTCYGCHAEDDFHDGRSGEQCENCHSPVSWNDTSFNHARDTEFPLEGRHAKLTCDDCHSEDPFSDTLETGCVSCHLEDDDHDGHNGEDCAACHSNDDWTDSIFDHDRDTEFTLNGSHEEVACNECHAEPIFDSSPGTDCHSCHAEDDVHEGQQGESCNDCHTETSWEEVTNFDHDLTKFPLLGEHDNLECDDCHSTQVFADVESDCVDCHEEDDTHGEKFEDDCGSCHNPVAWDLWLFDHNVQTDFVLDGAHVDVTCDDCHRSSLATMKRVGESCSDCHRADDVHDGEFGADCGRCHSDSSFKDVRSLQ